MKIGAFIVPTGIGASIGGFAGDASRWARRISKKSKLIVNPNVVNAACFSGINDNMLYVEGFSLDQFFKGNCCLCELRDSISNKIGVVFDRSIPQDVLNVNINTINAIKTVYDIDIYGYEVTADEVGVNFFVDSCGFSTGSVKNLRTIKESAQKLLTKGCTAIAIVCMFPEDQGGDYEKGIGVDPVGGVEAIISHYISKELKVPCAHAPAFFDYSIHSEIVDPRCSAEFITPTFLPCILLGLSQAPKITASEGISVQDLDFVVLPYNALGGIPALESIKHGIKLYAVEENVSLLNLSPENFQIKCDIIKTYEELLELL